MSSENHNSSVFSSDLLLRISQVSIAIFMPANNALIFFHLEGHDSGLQMLQALHDDDFARNNIAPPGGIQKSSFFEAMTERGLDQFLFCFSGITKASLHLLAQDVLVKFEKLADEDGDDRQESDIFPEGDGVAEQSVNSEDADRPFGPDHRHADEGNRTFVDGCPGPGPVQKKRFTVDVRHHEG